MKHAKLLCGWRYKLTAQTERWKAELEAVRGKVDALIAARAISVQHAAATAGPGAAVTNDTLQEGASAQEPPATSGVVDVRADDDLQLPLTVDVFREEGRALIKKLGSDDEQVRSDNKAGGSTGTTGRDAFPNEAFYVLLLLKKALGDGTESGKELKVPDVLVFNHRTGRLPDAASLAGVIDVPLSAAGRERNEGVRRRVQRELGLAAPWDIEAGQGPVLSGLELMRSELMREVERALYNQTLLLALMKSRLGGLRGDSRSRQDVQVTKLEKEVGRLYDRWVAWGTASFLGLQRLEQFTPDFLSRWSRERVIEHRELPWRSEGGATPLSTESVEELGCAGAATFVSAHFRLPLPTYHVLFSLPPVVFRDSWAPCSAKTLTRHTVSPHDPHRGRGTRCGLHPRRMLVMAEAKLSRAEEERARLEMEFKMTREHFRKCDAALAAGEVEQLRRIEEIEARVQARPRHLCADSVSMPFASLIVIF